MALDYGYRAVGAATIHDDVFQLGVILIQHRAQSGFEERSLVKARCDYRDFWQSHLWLVTQDVRNRAQVQKGPSRNILRNPLLRVPALPSKESTGPLRPSGSILVQRF